MRKHLGNYKGFFTESFLTTYDSLHATSKKLVKSKVQDIIRDPWHNQRTMKGDYKGTRHRNVNRRDRIIFTICEDCRENRWESYNQCSDCGSSPDEKVTFVQIILNHKY